MYQADLNLIEPSYWFIVELILISLSNSEFLLYEITFNFNEKVTQKEVTIK